MDRLRVQQQFEQLQNRYIGVGNPDTTRDEWRSNVARDSYASYIGHPPMLQHFSIALGQPQAVTHAQFIDRQMQSFIPVDSGLSDPRIKVQMGTEMLTFDLENDHSDSQNESKWVLKIKLPFYQMWKFNLIP
ncbi:hypothetical protein TRICI_006892 [Trichomonascus ciferrii]|uniref:Splicing factor subunit n=1 Tax=Trichomonascus ciferrii TaxID=44093 RepID=A0A6A1LNK9_9ASCO|nr:hypothetical protein TRICI_006892 [Trichomonascus ciferrii]